MEHANYSRQTQHSQQTPYSAIASLERQQVAELLPSQRVAFYEQALVQHSPIRIFSDGTFSKLDTRLVSTWQLSIPTHENDALAAEAAQVFYSRNESAIPIATVPSFVAWRPGSAFKPGDFVTQLAVLYGAPHQPGGGNAELLPLLSLPCLRAVRLVFQEYGGKNPGLSSYLRPSAWAIMELTKRPALTVQLQLRRVHYGVDDSEEDEDEAPLRDVTHYLDPPSAEEERIVEASQRAVKEYRGGSASVMSILMESGWSLEASDGVLELQCRVMVRDWVEEQRVEVLASQDVEMS